MSILVTTSYLPPVSFISACFGRQKIIIEGFETYTRQTFRNHCLIYGPNGIQQLSVPVSKVYGNHTRTRDIRIFHGSNWQKNHWRSIETAYNNSPFFLYYRDHFESFYVQKFDLLLDLNSELLKVIFSILGTEKEIGFTD